MIAVLSALSKVDRFHINVMFLSKSDKAVVHELFTFVQSTSDGVLYMNEDLPALRKAYGLK